MSKVRDIRSGPGRAPPKRRPVRRRRARQTKDLEPLPFATRSATALGVRHRVGKLGRGRGFMASEDKPGWFGRLFGRKGQSTGDGTDEHKAETELPADAPASPSEGQPDYATGAEDVAHVPLQPEETERPRRRRGRGGRTCSDRRRARAAARRHGRGRSRARCRPGRYRGREPGAGGRADARHPAGGFRRRARPRCRRRADREPEAKGWWTRLTSGMKRTSSA